MIQGKVHVILLTACGMHSGVGFRAQHWGLNAVGDVQVLMEVSHCCGLSAHDMHVFDTETIIAAIIAAVVSSVSVSAGNDRRDVQACGEAPGLPPIQPHQPG